MLIKQDPFDGDMFHVYTKAYGRKLLCFSVHSDILKLMLSGEDVTAIEECGEVECEVKMSLVESVKPW